jgi:hypothetical protein
MSNVREFDASTPPREPPGPPEPARPEGFLISDRQFMHDVETLKDLRSFMIQQAVSLRPSEAGKISLGVLNLLRYDDRGRLPSLTEWQLLEDHTQEFYEHLTDPVRRKFLYGRIPNWVVQTAGGLGVAALMALFLPFIVWDPKIPFLSYLIWVTALGGVGSIAFIGMNALAVQDDATFDITNTKLIALRVALGALFGAVLTLPVGYASFNEFVDELRMGTKPATESLLVSRSVLLLLPFILGFSTSLVIMILNQFVEAVQSFFGKKSSSLPPAAPPAAPVTPPPATVKTN